MKSIIATALLGSLLILSACDKDIIRGSGPVITETKTLPAFTLVQMDGNVPVTINFGAVQQVTVNGYENLLPIFEVKMTGNILHIGFKPGYNVRNSNVRVDIVVPDISFVRTNGSGSIAVGGFLAGNILEAFVNGSGDVLVQNSRFNKVTYSVNGSGDINAGTTEALEAIASIHGSGNISLKVSDKLDAHISGSGDIDYWGNPPIVNTNVSGSGRIKRN